MLSGVDGTIPALLDVQVTADPSRPFVTWYDQADGGRVELSVLTTANWVAKTAGLLRDVLDAAPGSRVSIDLPTHWQGVVWVLASWTVGAVLVPPGNPWIDVAVVGPAVLSGEVPDAQEVVGTALHPLGARFTEPLPVGVTDFGAEVLAMPDAFGSISPVQPDAAAWRDPSGELQQAELLSLGAARAHSLGLGGAGRLLSTANPSTRDGALTSLLAPLSVSGSVILVSNPKPDRLAALGAQERADVVAG